MLHELVASLETENQVYLKRVEDFGIFTNSLSQAIPQTAISHIVMDFLSEKKGDLKNKVAVIGYDGARADLLPNVLQVNNQENTDFSNFDLTTSGEFQSSLNSGINHLVAAGGKVYLTFAGGHIGEETEQPTVTAPGWASINSGVWSNEHGITDNEKPKSNNFKSFALQAAEKHGLKSAFAASWINYFSVNYLPEIEYVKNHPEISIDYQKGEDDVEVFQYMKHCLTEGDPLESDVTFCTFEATDANGYAHGFTNLNYHYVNGFRDEDGLANELIKTIESRPSYEKENWLIILTTDHGGFHFNHGGQTVEERTTWMASNQEISSKYFSKGYNGYQ